MTVRVPWPAAALALGQLALMATSLVFSLTLAYGGGLAAVGTIASAMLIFQLSVGALQRALAEATLLAESHADRRADDRTCRWAVGAAITGGTAGAVAAVLSALLVPHAALELAVAYAAGVPFAIALDIGRSASVAAGAARFAFVESALWLTAQTASMLAFAVVRSPRGICVSWAVVNIVFFLAAALLRSHRRPAFRGLPQWLRSRRGMLGPATLDALLVGLTPLLAIQVTGFVVTAAVLGGVRILQQVYAPLAFVSITLRRVLVYRRTGTAGSARGDLRDGLAAMALMAAGAVVIGAGILLGRRLVPALAFIPAGGALIAAGVEKAALGLSYGSSLGKFVRGEFAVLLRTRYVMLVLTLIAAPLLASRYDAVGYLLGSSLGMVGYAIAVILWPEHDRRPTHPAPAEAA